MQLEDTGPEAVTSPLLNRAQQTEVENSQKSSQRIEVISFGGMAGKPIQTGRSTSADCYQAEVDQGCETNNPYAPFNSQADWEFAKWAKLRGPTSTAVTDLLSIPDVSHSDCSSQPCSNG